MNIDNFKKNHTNETQNLERKINLLRSKLDNKQGYFICEQDIIGLKIVFIIIVPINTLNFQNKESLLD